MNREETRKAIEVPFNKTGTVGGTTLVGVRFRQTLTDKEIDEIIAKATIGYWRKMRGS